MALYEGYAYFDSVGGYDSDARRRVARLLEQLRDEGLITSYAIEQAEDIEHEMEGPATWCSQIRVEFSLEDDGRRNEEIPDDDWDDYIAPAQRQLEALTARVRELEGGSYEVYFNDDEGECHDVGRLDVEEATPVARFESEGTFMSGRFATSSDARSRYRSLLSKWQQGRLITSYEVDRQHAGVIVDDEHMSGKVRIHFGLADNDGLLAEASALLAERREFLVRTAAEAGVEISGFDAVCAISLG